MKLGLYSITYLGLWYRGEALSLAEMIGRAKMYGYDGIEIDGSARTAIHSTGRRTVATTCRAGRRRRDRDLRGGGQ